MPDVYERYRELVDQAERRIADRKEAEKIRIQVGNATCENAAGSREVYEEFRKHIAASGRDDILLRQAGCTGRCSCEPIVNITLPGRQTVKYECVDRDRTHEIFTTHVMRGKPMLSAVLDDQDEFRPRQEFFFCQAERCGKLLEKDFQQIFRDKLREANVPDSTAQVRAANCFGLCQTDVVGKAIHVLALPEKVVYRVESEEDLDEIVETHVKAGRTVERLAMPNEPLSQRFFELYGDVAFFNRQSRIALRNSGIIDPESLDEYLQVGGFESLARVLDGGDPTGVIEEITASKLRGRGGGGYPTGLKWANAAGQQSDRKYMICNADEGDPGAFMDRSMLESDPLSIIEGMAIGAYAIGASEGYFYVRAEYPLAIRRLDKAIALAREANLLGRDILGSGFDFDLELRLGAGAFVCGEETALIHSIEGERGEPRIRPPYPSQKGLWGRPTVINNVGTFANVPVVLQYGAQWFSQIGTEGSGGTKVFALAGKVNHTGLVEVPMGTTLRTIVFEIGGGVSDGKSLKAIQTGGPAGGCLPARWLDTEVDFDSLTQAGSIMGSGGMIVIDEDDCMVDIAKYFMTFSQDESCGKCTPCREGTKRMLEILTNITEGRGEPGDIAKLERLGKLMQKASLCGLGRAAANPVLSTIRHFRDEYEAHVRDKRCPSRKCTSLLYYEIIPDNCVGCTACARNCPVQCIEGAPKQVHVIDQTRCIKCGKCFEVCRFEAVRKN
jgi:NADH:ubiquinone oxidoreductase subunit F (NADH-binding)/(2Fe-2S) ferredoxin